MTPTLRLVAVPGVARALIRPEALEMAPLLGGVTGSSDPRRRLIDRLGLATSRLTLAASSARQHQATSATVPWPVDFAKVVEEWTTALPGFDLIGVVLPRQTGRTRLSALGWYGGNPVVLKVGERGDGLEREAEALTALTHDPLPGIATPRVLASGFGASLGDVVWHATSAVSLDRQRPMTNAALGSFEKDLTRRLSHLPRDAGQDGDGDVIIHGDLTPWNLRRTKYALALFDWEACRWGPAGYDQRFYRAACAELRESSRSLPGKLTSARKVAS